MTWDETVAVLRRWAGRRVIVVAILEPGISLAPFTGPLALEETERGVVRVRAGEEGQPIAVRRATFIEADWVPGQEDQGLSLVQGGVRVDVFLES